MARYEVSVYSGPQHRPKATLMLIASMLGLPSIEGLNVNTSKQATGTVSLEVATMHQGVVEGIKKLDGVQAVVPIGHG